MTVRRTSVRLAAVALAAGVALGASGCSFITPIATQNQYNPSDGINATIGDVDVRNVVGIINEDGHAINLLITLLNRADRAVQVTLQFESGGQKTDSKVALRPGEVLQFGDEAAGQDQIIILNPSVRAGELLPVYVQYGAEPGKQLTVPVLDGTQGEYEGLIPPAVER